MLLPATIAQQFYTNDLSVLTSGLSVEQDRDRADQAVREALADRIDLNVVISCPLKQLYYPSLSVIGNG
ncbi:MAG: hypothetical protein C4322_12525 [Mastigocladus sp. ERB_26_1]